MQIVVRLLQHGQRRQSEKQGRNKAKAMIKALDQCAHCIDTSLSPKEWVSRVEVDLRKGESCGRAVLRCVFPGHTYEEITACIRERMGENPFDTVSLLIQDPVYSEALREQFACAVEDGQKRFPPAKKRQIA